MTVESLIAIVAMFLFILWYACTTALQEFREMSTNIVTVPLDFAFYSKEDTEVTWEDDEESPPSYVDAVSNSSIRCV